MLTKRSLGVGYLLGSGLGLLLSLTGYFALTRTKAIVVGVGTVSAAILAITIVSVGYWLLRSDLEDDTIWSIAMASAVGLAIPTLLGVFITVVQVQTPLVLMVPALLVNVIAGGAVGGLLAGSVSELRRENLKARELHERNLVLNRILRHNVRNDMNVILGYVEELERKITEDKSGPVAPIKRKAKDAVALSDMARRVETLEAETADRPTNIVRVLETRIEATRQAYPEVDLSAYLPEEAWAEVDSIIGAVLDNVIQNAIEHNDGEPRIAVSVSVGHPTEGWVTIRVEDNGPGLQEMPAAEPTGETGIGLHLVEWFVDHYQGELSLDAIGSKGSVVTVKLPRAKPSRRLARSRYR